MSQIDAIDKFEELIGRAGTRALLSVSKVIWLSWPRDLDLLANRNFDRRASLEPRASWRRSQASREVDPSRRKKDEVTNPLREKLDHRRIQPPVYILPNLRGPAAGPAHAPG